MGKAMGGIVADNRCPLPCDGRLVLSEEADHPSPLGFDPEPQPFERRVIEFHLVRYYAHGPVPACAALPPKTMVAGISTQGSIRQFTTRIRERYWERHLSGPDVTPVEGRVARPNR